MTDDISGASLRAAWQQGESAAHPDDLYSARPRRQGREAVPAVRDEAAPVDGASANANATTPARATTAPPDAPTPLAAEDPIHPRRGQHRVALPIGDAELDRVVAPDRHGDLPREVEQRSVRPVQRGEVGHVLEAGAIAVQHLPGGAGGGALVVGLGQIVWRALRQNTADASLAAAGSSRVSRRNARHASHDSRVRRSPRVTAGAPPGGISNVREGALACVQTCVDSTQALALRAVLA